MKIKKNSDLRNAKSIGITIENYLNEIGIFTLADLAETTSVEGFQKNTKELSRKDNTYMSLSILFRRDFIKFTLE